MKEAPHENKGRWKDRWEKKSSFCCERRAMFKDRQQHLSNLGDPMM